jgi:hypothetical protein
LGPLALHKSDKSLIRVLVKDQFNNTLNACIGTDVSDLYQTSARTLVIS